MGILAFLNFGIVYNHVQGGSKEDDLYNPYKTEKRLELGFVKDDSQKKSKTNIVKVKKLSNIWLVSMEVKIKFTEKYIETSFRIELTRVLEEVLQ